VCCSALWCVAVLQQVRDTQWMLQCVAECCIVLQCVAACCSVCQCIAVCGSVLQCVAVRCGVLQYSSGGESPSAPGYIHVSIYICVYTRIHINMHTYMYMHIHTHKATKPLLMVRAFTNSTEKKKECVLQGGTECCRCCRVLQGVAGCCSVLQCVAA